MEKEKIEEICRLYESLNYVDKKDVFSRTFSFGALSGDLNDKLVLISLVSLTYIQMRKKNPMITPFEILIKITGIQIDNSFYCRFLESLSIVVEDFSYECKNIDSCGLKTSQEIINKIKELLDQWLPF